MFDHKCIYISTWQAQLNSDQFDSDSFFVI